jgi:hypothetical protein
MIPETIHIEELLLRLPNLDEVAARRIAAQVAERLSRSLGRSDLYPMPAGSTLRVRIPAGIPADELVDTIAQRILEALR